MSGNYDSDDKDKRGKVLEFLDEVKAKASEKGSMVLVSTSSPADCIGILTVLKEKFGRDGCHLSSIAGNDLGDGRFEVNYILLVQNVSLLVKTETQKDVESVTKIFPGAILYERELYEMFGIGVSGHPDLRNFFLPKELTKTGTYPLRKSLTSEKIREQLKGVIDQ